MHVITITNIDHNLLEVEVSVDVYKVYEDSRRQEESAAPAGAVKHPARRATAPSTPSRMPSSALTQKAAARPWVSLP